MIFFCGALSLTTVKNVRVEEINEDNENWGVALYTQILRLTTIKIHASNHSSRCHQC